MAILVVVMHGDGDLVNMPPHFDTLFNIRANKLVLLRGKGTQMHSESMHVAEMFAFARAFGLQG